MQTIGRNTTTKMTAAEAMATLLSRSRLIDLSVLTAADLPCVPAGAIPFAKSLFNSYTWPGGAFLEYVFVHDDHTGTHCDAPCHFIPPPELQLPHSSEHGRITIDQLPLEKLMGPAAVIDVRHLIDTVPPGKRTVLEYSPVITVKEIRDWEDKHGDLRPHEIVLFYTSWSDRYYNRYPDGFKFDRSHPAPNGEAIAYLAERGIEHIGTDGQGIGLLQDDYEPHWAALGRGMVVTEKLINLGQLPPRGAFFLFLPHKVEGVGGGLGRAIAIV